MWDKFNGLATGRWHDASLPNYHPEIENCNHCSHNHMSQRSNHSDSRIRNRRLRESAKRASSSDSVLAGSSEIRDLAESLHQQIMADSFDNDDPNLLLRKYHATALTSRLNASIPPIFQYAAGNRVRQQCSERRLRPAQATSLSSRDRGRTDQGDYSVKENIGSKSPVYQVPAVKQFKTLQLSSAPSRFLPLKVLAPGVLPETYAARHCVIRQNCVVKVIDLRSFVDQEGGIWSVHAEIQALRRIQRSGKPFLQQLSTFPFDPEIWCSSDAYLYLVLERYPYKLRQFEDSIPLDEMLLGSIIFSISSGLEALHNMGIIHANISPDSIFVDTSGHCVIGEFGDSIVLPSSRPMPGATCTVEGGTQISTNIYTAPELSRGSKLYVFDESMDYWSLGLTIVTLVVGEKILAELKETFNDTDLQEEIMQEMLSKLCPRNIAEVVSLLCQVDPKLRLRDKDTPRLCWQYGWRQQDSEALLRVKPRLTRTRKRNSPNHTTPKHRLDNLAEANELFDQFMNAVDLWMPKDEDGRFLSAFEYLP